MTTKIKNFGKNIVSGSFILIYLIACLKTREKLTTNLALKTAFKHDTIFLIGGSEKGEHFPIFTSNEFMNNVIG